MSLTTRGRRAQPRHPRVDTPPVVLLATALVTMGFGAIFALLPDYQNALGFASWGLGAVTSASFVAGFIAQFALARYADRGWGRTMLIGGVGVAGIGCLGIALAPTFALLLLARVALGFGEGVFLPAARRVIITRNPEAVGAALGRMGAMATAGFLLGPPFAAFVASATTLRVPFVVLALVLFVIVPLVARFDVPAHEEEHHPKALRALVRMPGVRRGLYLIIGFATAIGVYDSLWAKFLKDLGASTRFVSVSLTVFAAPIALLAPTAGRLADRYGPRRIGSLAALGSAPFIALYGVITSYWTIAVLAAGHSVFDSAIVPSAQSQVARTTPPNLVAAGQGLLDGTSLLASAASAAVAAPIYAHWGAGALWIGLAAIVAVFAIVAGRPERAPRGMTRSERLHAAA
jgi:MFS family permease